MHMYMYKFFISIFLLSLISGCAGKNPQQLEAYRQSIPTCEEERECKAKWSAARRWVTNNARRKIQIYSDDLIETYNPAPNSPLLAARVTKDPKSSGGYTITANVWCNNMFGCHPDKLEALISFNNYVNAIKVKPKRYKSSHTPNTIESKIQSLKNLLNKGLITQKEYNQKKTELLKNY